MPESITEDTYFRVTWSPRFCPRSNGDYSVESPDPDVKSFGISTFSGLELELDKAIISSDGRRVTVNSNGRRWFGAPMTWTTKVL